MKIKIISVVYNSVNTIEKCILSVLNQTYSNIEYIIIDGASIDGTLELIEKYSNQVYILPKSLDEKVARLHLEKLGVKLSKLNAEQAKYIGVSVSGPFKSDDYRY